MALFYKKWVLFKYKMGPMTNYNDRKHHFRANVEESNENATSQLILKDNFLKYLKLVQFKGSLRLQFKGILSNSRLFVLKNVNYGYEPVQK